LEDILSGRPGKHTVVALTPTVALSCRADTFTELLADHRGLSNGLFRRSFDTNAPDTILRSGAVWPASFAQPALDGTRPLSLAERALLLEEVPAFSQASGDELLLLAAAVGEIELRHGTKVCEPTDQPSLIILLSGELSVTGQALPSPLVVRAGDVLGGRATLIGGAMGIRATVTSAGRALQLHRDDLFDIFDEHVRLLRAVFRSVLDIGEPGTPKS
jgi:CRP-like cAMP-binding protein